MPAGRNPPKTLLIDRDKDGIIFGDSFGAAKRVFFIIDDSMKKGQLSGYNRLVMQIEKSTARHPRSQVVIDARTLEVVFVGTDAKKKSVEW